MLVPFNAYRFIPSHLFYSVENITREVEMAYVITIAISALAFKRKNS